MRALYDVPAPAKLNLFLHVVGKRPDGYHLLQSIFALVDWADTLHFERRDDGQLLRHDQGDPLPADDLCLRAARLLQRESGCTRGVDIHIEKRLPSGAGMGGGSSDAASTLLALNRLWDLNWPLARLLPMGLSLGADLPFFLGGSNAFVEGIGEVLHPISLPEQWFAIVKPTISIPTKEIFSSPLLARSESVAIVAGFPAHDGSEDKASQEWLCQGFGRNDLQPPAEAFSGEVSQALQLLQDRFGNSRMTGSGSAVFARVDGEEGKSLQSMATMLQEKDLPAGWVGKICRSLNQHPLSGWAG
ncbi:4-(cytidine 5'-diphospho)-2-C-methyl-D-erythritol kinase [Pelomonas sp. SE-A7]|uniref:4-(cytidine 5'-diphospho)-2-C-methyl-D-erythritol kinase n=1 Tax=Pelomonas sp. SE-A7 TaxID=3054953 RepID=UPI00259D09F8|nr:4-(cytidine 5'-diphospho)-2-C-methyl-D-erythritol kinase [Pelomonas sp. SE-A7]MDM4766387.1 4-(cytidine 5'-diphospho)-2-C-methyl-D-erythritol kinase [Pelomonas sp. SE-A7]